MPLIWSRARFTAWKSYFLVPGTGGGAEPALRMRAKVAPSTPRYERTKCVETNLVFGSDVLVVIGSATPDYARDRSACEDVVGIGARADLVREAIVARSLRRRPEHASETVSDATASTSLGMRLAATSRRNVGMAIWPRQ